jgi:peptide/nickel transport system permease protein
MLRFVVRRLLLLVPILLGLSILVFGWIHLLPGSPAEALLGEHATPQAVAQIRHQYGLDKPLYVQYWRYLDTTVHGDLGTSIASTRTITYELKHRFPATVELALAAMFFAIVVGLPLGFFAAKRYGSWFDNASLFASLIGISIPIFFLGLLLKYVFSVKLHWLPSVGREDFLADRAHPTNFYILDAILEGDPQALWDAIQHLILPAIALGSIPLAIVTRITRASTLDVQNEDYVRTARAKGLAPLTVDRRHVLRNALLPVSTIIGLQVGLLLSGAVLTETIFAWPGVGSWLKEAIFNRDYPVLQGGILFLAVVFVVVNLIVDLSYAIINPRIRLS